MAFKVEDVVNDYIKTELRSQVNIFIDEYLRRFRKWIILFAVLISSVLLVVMVVMMYIGIVFYKWNILWEEKASYDKAMREQFIQDRYDWINDSLKVKHARIQKK
jgi:hypothetical protein